MNDIVEEDPGIVIPAVVTEMARLKTLLKSRFRIELERKAQRLYHRVVCFDSLHLEGVVFPLFQGAPLFSVKRIGLSLRFTI